MEWNIGNGSSVQRTLAFFLAVLWTGSAPGSAHEPLTLQRIFASPALDRILPIAHIPLYDVELAHRELERCLKLGFKGMFLAPEPVCGKRPSHPDFDPIWQLLIDADLRKLTLHHVFKEERRGNGV